MLRKDKNKTNPEYTEAKSGSLFKRRLNYGIGYVLLIVAILVVFVVVNVLLERLPMSVDLTANEQFSITDETRSILEGLDEDIEIVALYDRVKGMANTQQAEVIRILDLYDSYSHVDVSYVSLNSNPNIINDTVGQASAAAYSEGDYIVKSGKRTKRIAANDMFETDTEYISNIIPVTYTTGNRTESEVSTAIRYVTLETIPNVYISTGLQENAQSEYSKIFEDLDNMNILTKEFNLSQVDAIPEDAGAIVFLSPKRDLSEVEYDLLRGWLTDAEKAGMLFVAFDSDRTGVKFDRFNRLLSDLYGISVNNTIVSDEAAYQIAAAAKPSVITASVQQNGPLSVNNLRDTYFSYDSRSINIVSSTGYYESYPLVQTSSTATSTAYGDGAETKGVATLAAAGDYYGDGPHSRCVVLGSSLGLKDEYIQKYSNVSSELMFLYSIDWMIGADAMDSLEIGTKQYSTAALTVDSARGNWIFAFSIIIYPLAIIAVGVVIWLRRRHL